MERPATCPATWRRNLTEAFRLWARYSIRILAPLKSSAKYTENRCRSIITLTCIPVLDWVAFGCLGERQTIWPKRSLSDRSGLNEGVVASPSDPHFSREATTHIVFFPKRITMAREMTDH
jgi:hypothetical protein